MTQFTKYSRYGNGYLTNARTRKILAARHRLTLNAPLGRGSSSAVKRMAGMEVPLVIESRHLAKRVRKDAGARNPTDFRERLHLGPSSAERSTEPTHDPALGTATAVSLTKSTEMLTAPAVSKDASVSIMPAGEEHSGNVTLYLPKDLNQWLREFHDISDISYRNIVLNAISWAKCGELLSGIFAREDRTVPADDIFGRPQALPRKAKSPGGHTTRPVRFSKYQMRVIMSLAREWTGDNRNAFFIGVLIAYQDQQIRSSVATND